MLRLFSTLLLLALSTAARADRCPEGGEEIGTTPYRKYFQCGAANIIVEGEKQRPEEYWECFGDVPSKKETAFYSTKQKTKTALPKVSSVLKTKDTNILDRIWVVSDVQCQGKSYIQIRYWGGGNCKECEQLVHYKFSSRGELRRVYQK